MQTGALCDLRLLGRPDLLRTFSLYGSCPLSRLDLHRTFTLGVERPDSCILASGQAEGKTDFLSCKVFRILRSSEYCLLSDHYLQILSYSAISIIENRFCNKTSGITVSLL
jgi:hypothetical protein